MNSVRPLRVVFTSDHERPVRWEQAAMDAVLALDGVQSAGLFRSVDHAPAKGKGLRGAMEQRLGDRLLKREAWRAISSDRPAFTDAPSIPPACDLIIHFGAEDLPDTWTKAAILGIWCLCDGQGRPMAEAHPALAAWVSGERNWALTARQQDERGKRTLLERVYPLPSNRVGDALSNVMMHAADVFTQLCVPLMRNEHPRPIEVDHPTYGPLPVLRSVGTLFKDLFPLFDLPRRVPELTWNIGLAEHPIERCLSGAPYNVRWMAPPGEGASRRNPSGYMHEERLNVLYAKNGDEGRQVIARLRPKPDQLLKRSRTMLSGAKDHEHAFIVAQGEEIFAVLGAPGNDGVVLYRIMTANDGMEPVATICDTPLHHATLFEHEGRWWLMGSGAAYPEAELHVFHAERITGPFRSHAQAPVKVDVRSSKPAGTPFVHEGALYRPAQDLGDIGRPQVVMTRILELTPTSFREEVVFRVPAAAGSIWNHATSTLCAVNGNLVIGGARRPAGVPVEDRHHHRSFDDE